MIRRVCALAGVVVLALCASPAHADEQCHKPCAENVVCEVEVTDCLIASGKPREAIDRLKPLAEKHPGQPGFARLLARAYLADENPFWAQRTLQTVVEADPSDCESRSWLAWVHIQQGDLDLAREVMKEPGCPRSSADRGRFEVLGALIARAEKDEQKAASSVETLGQSDELYPEDGRVWRHLRSQQDPGWIEPLSLRAELLAGYTSDGRGGSPADVTAGGDDTAHSALGRIDLFGRLILPIDRTVRPALEGQVKGHGLTAEQARDLSYLDLSTRPGVIIGSAFPRVFAGYKANLLLMGLKDKELYYEAHRGELELETDFGLLVFGGAGRRIFREAGRTRTEFDGGVGGSLAVSRRVQLLLALSLRYYLAVGDPYDQVGGSVVVATRFDLGSGFYGRLGATPSLDAYPDSGGELGQEAFGTRNKRSDLLVKLTAEAWTPPWHSVRFGLRYEYAGRNSTADEANSDYDYQEHRVLAGLRFKADLNPGAPRIVSPRGHVELDYGIGERAGASIDEERIQDLLRQDEAARAGSSCVE